MNTQVANRLVHFATQLSWGLCVSLATGCAPTGAQAQITDHCYTALPPKNAAGNDKPIEPVCRVLEQNLNQFCDEPPMVCGLRIAPRFSNELAVPVWDPVDFGGRLSFVEALVRGEIEYLNAGKAATDVWNDFRAGYEEALQAGRLTVLTADLDMYRLGRPLTVYRVDPGDCEKRNSSQLNSREQWNAQLASAGVFVYTAPEAVKSLEPQYRFGPTPTGDVFLYNGRAYFYNMGVLRPTSTGQPYNAVVVNEGSDEAAPDRLLSISNVCEITYQDKGSER